MKDNRVLFMTQHMKIRGLDDNSRKREIIKILITYCKQIDIESMSYSDMKNKAAEYYTDYVKDNNLYYQRTDITIVKVDYYNYAEGDVVIALDSGLSKFKVDGNKFTMSMGRRYYEADTPEDMELLKRFIDITSNRKSFKVPDRVRHQYCAIWLNVRGKLVRSTRRNMVNVVGSYVEIASKDGKYVYRTVGVGGDFVCSREEVYNSELAHLLGEPIGAEVACDDVVHYHTQLANGNRIDNTLTITGLYKADMGYKTYNFIKRELSNKGELLDLDNCESGKYIYEAYQNRYSRKYKAVNKLYSMFTEEEIASKQRMLDSDWVNKYICIEEAILASEGVSINV